MSPQQEEERSSREEPIVRSFPVAGTPETRRAARAADRRARGNQPKRSPWHVGSFLRRFLVAVAVGVPVIMLTAPSWGEALVWSGVLVAALQALYLALALFFG